MTTRTQYMRRRTRRTGVGGGVGSRRLDTTLVRHMGLKMNACGYAGKCTMVCTQMHE